MRKTHTMRTIQRTAALALSAALALAGRSYGDVISERVPATALAVVKFNNVGATSAKVAKLAEKLGVNMFVPALNDPLGALKQQLKITGGLKEDGEFAFVYVEPKGAQGEAVDPNKSALMLVPTSDYKTLVANLEGATTEGNVTTAKGSDGQTIYLADWNGYAAVSPTKELVAAAPGAGLKLPARATKETAENDVTLYANLAAIREPLMAKIKDGREKSKAEMLDKVKSDNKIPEKYHAALGAGVDQLMNAAEAFLRDADAATVGLTIAESGVKQTIVAEFKEGSYLATTVDGFKNSPTTLLNSLPTGKYLAFGGFANSPDAVAKLIDDVGGPVLAALPKDDELSQKIPAYIADVKALLANVTEQSFGLITPTGAVGQTALIQPIGAIKGDAAKLTSQMKSINEKYAAFTNEILAATEPGVEMKQTWTDGAKTVGGVSFSSVSTEIVGDSPAANQQRQQMQFMYGAPKMDMFFGSTGDEVVSFANGIDEGVINELIANAKGNKSPLADAETVKAVAAELPKQRIAEVYVGVDEIMTLGIRSAKQFGFFQGDVQLPPDLQPVGVSIAGEKGALEISEYISDDLLQALVSAGMQVAAQMQGGGRGANGGGL